MTNPVPTLTGDRLILRAFRDSDIDDRFALGRSDQIVRAFGGDPTTLPPFTLDSARDWVARNKSHPLAWAIEESGTLLGALQLNDHNTHDRRARLALGLLNPAKLGQGFGREAIGLILSHGFGAMGLHRISLRVLASNTRAIRCYRACGFVEEGRERQSARVGNDWQDDLIMGLLAPEFRAKG